MPVFVIPTLKAELLFAHCQTGKSPLVSIDQNHVFAPSAFFV